MPAHHNVGGQRGVGDIHVGRQGRHCVGQHCSRRVGRAGGHVLECSVMQSTDSQHKAGRQAGGQAGGQAGRRAGRQAGRLTDACGECKEVDEPEEEEAALQGHRPVHNVGCTKRWGGTPPTTSASQRLAACRAASEAGHASLKRTPLPAARHNNVSNCPRPACLRAGRTAGSTHQRRLS